MALVSSLQQILTATNNVAMNHTILQLLQFVAQNIDSLDQKQNFIPNIAHENVYINREEAVTELAENRKFEFHKAYYDVHIVLTGSETIYYRETEVDQNDQIITAFSDEKDVGFIADQGNITKVTLHPGDLLLLDPLLPHKPLCAVDKPQNIAKLVMKIRASYLQ